jgi:hypothetical protein
MKKRNLLKTSVALAILGSVFGGTAAWAAGSGTVNWSGKGIGSTSSAFSVTSDTSYLTLRLNSPARGGYSNTNITWGISEAQFQLQRNVGYWTSVGNMQALTGTTMNWGARINGSYRFQLNGVRAVGYGWQGQGANIYIITGSGPYTWG